jgi:hypothetical protein
MIRKDLPPGPARLLAALVRRGLRRDCLTFAAALCLELDALAWEGK